MKDESPMAGRSLLFTTNAATRPWLACAGLGFVAAACILGFVALLGEDINGLVKAMPFVVGVGAAVVAADTWRTRPAATGAELKKTQEDIADLRQELGALKGTFQQIRGTLPQLPGRIEQLEGTVRKLDDRISGLALPSAAPSPETAVGMVRTLLAQTDNAFSRKFTDMSTDVGSKIEAVGKEITKDVAELKGVVKTKVEDLLEKMERSTEGREELTRRLQQMTVVLNELTTLSGQMGKYDPGIVRGVADRVAALEGLGGETRGVLDKLQADLRQLNNMGQTLSTVLDTQQNMVQTLAKITSTRPLPTPPPPPVWAPTVSLIPQLELLSKCYQVEEKEVGMFAMAPFWLACASVLPGAISQAGGFDPALRARSHDVVESSREILDRAAVQLEKDGYKKNISRMWASFDAGSTARDQAERLVEGVVQELSGVLLGQQQKVTGEVGRVSSSLDALRKRLGTLAFLLPAVSFDVLGRDPPDTGAGKELAWVLLGKAMAGYIEKHYGGRLLA